MGPSRVAGSGDDPRRPFEFQPQRGEGVSRRILFNSSPRDVSRNLQKAAENANKLINVFHQEMRDNVYRMEHMESQLHTYRQSNSVLERQVATLKGQLNFLQDQLTKKEEECKALLAEKSPPPKENHDPPPPPERDQVKRQRGGGS